MTEKTRIQNELISLAKAGDFYAVNYDPTTKLALDIDPETDDKIVPASVLCNEIHSSFEMDTRNGRRHSLARNSWIFDLMIGFHQEVNLEFFENSLIDPTILIPADPANDLPQVRLLLDHVSPDHPQTQEAPKGTKAVLTFATLMSRN